MWTKYYYPLPPPRRDQPQKKKLVDKQRGYQSINDNTINIETQDLSTLVQTIGETLKDNF